MCFNQEPEAQKHTCTSNLLDIFLRVRSVTFRNKLENLGKISEFFVFTKTLRIVT